MDTLISNLGPELAERSITVAGAKELAHHHANIDAAPQGHWAFLAMQEMHYNSILIGD